MKNRKVKSNNKRITNKIVLMHSGIIGRSEEVEYSLWHLSVSRKHCEIIIKGNSVRIRDLQSKNGTYVNNALIKETFIVEGDIIRIGELFFQISHENEISIMNLRTEDEILSGQNNAPPARSSNELIRGTPFANAGKKNPSLAQRHDETMIQPIVSDKKDDLIQIIEDLPVKAEPDQKGFKQAFAELRKKLGCYALFFIELSESGCTVREKYAPGNFILSSTVIRYMKSQWAAKKILKMQEQPVERKSALSSDNFLKGIWAPKELKEESESLMGAAENSIYCVPLQDNDENEILLYAYWHNGCGSPKLVEKIIQNDRGLIASLVIIKWTEENKLGAYKQALRTLSEPLVGNSPAFLTVIEQAYKLAMTDFSVVLLGPRGCGKTTVAHAIHEWSHRKDYPFKAFNCANFQPNLIESELFGSKRGAYTDAVERKGHLLEADHGTIFIDSIESCPIEVQAKLRDVLEGRPFRAIGSEKEEHVDVRFLAATNEDPVILYQENRLRLDFWDRIGVQFIYIPPLWQRLPDIPALAFHFLENEKMKCARPGKLKGFSLEAMKALKSYYWPGNVRELCNVISRLIIQAENEIATEDDIRSAINTGNHRHEIGTLKSIFDLPYIDACKTFSQMYLQRKLDDAGNKKGIAADLAKLSRKTFYGLLKKRGLSDNNK